MSDLFRNHIVGFPTRRLIREHLSVGGERFALSTGNMPLGDLPATVAEYPDMTSAVDHSHKAPI